MKVTMKMIAEICKVNVSTVSRVINKTATISPKVTKKILSVAKKFNYQPHAYARSLAKQKAWTVSLVVPNFYFLYGPFFQRLLHGISNELLSLNYSLIITSLEKKGNESLLQIARSKKIDGALLLADTLSDKELALYTDLGIPFIIVNKKNPFANKNYVCLDNVTGGKIATQHLIEHGYKNLIYLGGDESYHVSQERLAGFKLAIQKMKDKMNIEEIRVFFGSFSQGVTWGYEIGSKLNLNPEKPAGVFAASDHIALGLKYYCNDHNLKVGKDVGIVGFDNWETMEFLSLGITSIDQNPFAMGSKACRFLVYQIEGGKSPNHAVIEPSLVIRQSCGCSKK